MDIRDLAGHFGSTYRWGASTPATGVRAATGWNAAIGAIRGCIQLSMVLSCPNHYLLGCAGVAGARCISGALTGGA